MSQKISELTLADALLNDDVFPITRQSENPKVNYKITGQTIIDALTASNQPNVISVSGFSGFDYENATPVASLVKPFKTLIRARDYLVSHGLIGYTIRVYPGEYTVPATQNLNYNGVWEFDANTKVNFNSGQAEGYLFSATFNITVKGKAFFKLTGANTRFAKCISSSSLVYNIELEKIEFVAPIFKVTTDICNLFITGGSAVSGLVNTLGSPINVFVDVDLNKGAFKFDNLQFIDCFIDINNYMRGTVSNAVFYTSSGDWNNRAYVTLGTTGDTSGSGYSLIFSNINFDIYLGVRPSRLGAVAINSPGVKANFNKCYFNRGGGANQYCFKSTEACTLIIHDCTSSSPIDGTINNPASARGLVVIPPLTGYQMSFS